LSASVFGLALATSGATASQGEAEAKTAADAAAHINLAGKLRMLSQRVPSHACQVTAGIGTDYAKEVLKGATAEFGTIVDALEFGNDDLGITHAEERRLTLAAIGKVRKAWAPLQELSDAAMNGSVTSEQIESAQGDSLALLETAKSLVVEEVGEYSNPAEMAAAESFLIDVAGRQRMLIQMMSKTACLTMSDHAAEAASKSLESTMGIFEATLGALQTGMPSVGIRKPPTTEIEAGLGEVAVQWNALKPFLTEVLGGAKVDSEKAANQFRALNEMMAQMNKVVGMYASAV
jgi:hypothetical protein